VTKPTDEPLRRTPALERVLARLRRRLVLGVWLHGAGTAIAAAAVWLFFAFTADYWLRVPVPVRMAHGVVLVLVTAYFLWRDLVRPLRRVPDRAGLCVLIEREHGGMDELLVSAVQLQREGAGAAGDAGTSPELVESVLAAAEARAASLDTRGVLAESGPRLRLGAGAALAGLLVLAAATNRELASIFLDHLLGGRAAWPQRTYLAVEIPLSDAAGKVRVDGETIFVRVARGTDVPVVVRASGALPSEVVLRFDDGRDRVLSPSGRGIYRTALRAPQDSLAFEAIGGDDDDGLPRVEVEVLQPPDVEGVAIRIEPPAWTDLAPSLAFNRDVEVVAGSHLSIHVLPTPRGANGVVRMLPADATLPLEPAPFPRSEDDDLRREDGLFFELDATESLGYRFELVDATGLSNPDPGLFRVTVLEDRPPEVRLLAPGRSEYDTVAGGMIPLRARAEDGFGLTALALSVRPYEPGRAGGNEGADADPLLELDLEPFVLAPENGTVPWIGSAGIEVDQLAGADDGENGALDRRFEIVVSALDNHRPEPQTGRSAPLRVRVISADELLRRTQDRLAAARLDVTRLADLQREKQTRVQELVDALEASGTVETGDALALHAAAVGQRRVQSDAATLSRDLAWAARDVLYSRLDEKAGPMLALLDKSSANLPDGGFHPEIWSSLGAALDAGELGAPVFAGNLVTLVAQSLAVSEEAAQSAALALDRAQKATGSEGALTALEDAYEQQSEALRRIEVLLASLAEWDNFQNVLTLTRDILQGQKALRDRTKRFAQDNEK